MFSRYGKLLAIAFLATLALAVGSGAQQSPRVITASGTGFIVGADGYILTNNHVIDKATSVKVRIAGTDFTASVVQKKPDQDLALLKISKSGLPAVALGDSDKIQIGDQVVAIGCPEGRCGTVTIGRVANLGQTATFAGGITLSNLIMIDVTIAPGSSGGPLFNMKGEVIGITMGGMEGTRFGFAIPINAAIPLLQQVPGFSRSKMGQATQELGISQIVAQAGPMVTYIEAKREVPLANLLPREALGLQLVPFPEFGFVSWHWWHWREPREVLQNDGLNVEAFDGVSGQGEGLTVLVGVFDLANEQQAKRAAQILTDPIRTVHQYPPDAEGESDFGVCVDMMVWSGCISWAVQYEHYELLVRKTENLGSIQVDLTTRVFSLEVPVDSSGNYTYWAGLLGAATFSLGDLTFFVVLRAERQLSLGKIVSDTLYCYVNSNNYVECFYPLFNTVVVSSLKVDNFLASFTSLLSTALSAALGRQ